VRPLVGEGGLRHVVVAAYSDYIGGDTDLKVPDFVAAPRRAVEGDGVVLWSDVRARTTCAACRTPRAPPATQRVACIPTAA